MQNPNFSPNETLRPLFNSVDTDKSGKITFNELQKVLTMPGSDINSVFSERCSKRLIRMFDRNGNGSIDFEEYSALHQYLIQMKQGFESVDIDKSGKIEFNELVNTLQKIGYSFSHVVFGKVFKTFDFQKKGWLNFDGYIELCVFLGLLRNQFNQKDLQRNGMAVFNMEQFAVACIDMYE